MATRTRAWICLCGLAAAPWAVLADGEATPPASQPVSVIDRIRELEQENMAPPDAKSGDSSLEDALRKLRSAMRLKPRWPILSPQPVPPSQPTSMPSTAPSSPTVPARPKTRLSPTVLARLKTFPAAEVADPTALGDALFRGGHLDVAATFYTLALERKPEASEAAWLLFQLGNCFRTSDPAAASDVYRRLIAEHPDTTWALLASATEELIRWRETNKPRAVLAAMAPKAAAPERPASVPTTQPAVATATQPAIAKSEGLPAVTRATN